MADSKIDALFCMLKGEPGTRKSTQALSFPGPQYWFSYDRKMTAITLPMKEWKIDPKTIEYDDYSDWMSGEKKLKELVMKCPYKTVIIDSITTLADAANDQTKGNKSGTTTKAGDEKGHRVGGIIVNTLEDYKAEASVFQDLIKHCQNIRKYHKCNIVLIAHIVGERKTEEARMTHMARIIVTGGKIISAKIPAKMEEIYHFNVKSAADTAQEGKYSIITSHSGDDYARTCLPLEREIIFGNNPLYSTYIKPAIDKLNNKP